MTLKLETRILLASLVLALTVTSARADRTVAPLVFGNYASGLPFALAAGGAPSMRYQQVYASAPFLSAAPQGMLITKIAFDKSSSIEFVSHQPHFQVNFSTPTRSPAGLAT